MAYTDRPDQVTVFAVFQQEIEDTFPQQEQRHRFFLVFFHNEGTAQFQTLFQYLRHVVTHPEQGLEIKAPFAVLFHDLIAGSDTVSPDDAFFCFIPDKQLVVIEVKLININAFIGTLPNCPEGDLP